MKWEEKSISFEGNVNVSLVSGKRIITRDGRVVLEGEKYLLPWNPLTEEKLYHWTSTAGTSTWTLPSKWNKITKVTLYKLTDQGRKFIQDIQVHDGTISILAEANTPYVIYKKKVSTSEEIKWGEGAFVRDPGFNHGDLKYWTANGTGAKVVRNSRGQYELVINGDQETAVSQKISGLATGSYYASVYVSNTGTRKANLEIIGRNGIVGKSYCNSSLWENFIAADSKNGTNMQRMYLFFQIPAGVNSVDLKLDAEVGHGEVVFDDVRIVPMQPSTKPEGLFFAEDFENITDGLYPFIKGPSGGINDPRTHLSELHFPYTQKGWNGKKIDDVISGNWSLKAHGEPKGLLLQTIPQTIRFTSGKTYTVTFKYETSGTDYAFVIGEGQKSKQSVLLELSDIPTTKTFTFLAGESGNSWFGIEKLNDKETDFVIDDLIIVEK